MEEGPFKEHYVRLKVKKKKKAVLILVRFLYMKTIKYYRNFTSITINIKSKRAVTYFNAHIIIHNRKKYYEI